MYNSLLMLIGEYLPTRSDHLWCKLPGFLSNYYFLQILEQKLPIKLIELVCRKRNLPKTYLWLYQKYLKNLINLQKDFYWSCKQGYLEIVKLLLKDDRIDPDDHQNLAIRWASEQGHLEIVRLLLQDSRVDPSDFKNYAIRYASKQGHLEVVRLLLQDPRVDPSYYFNLAIQWASQKGHLEVVRLLLQDSRVDPSDCENCAIRWASYQGHFKVVQLLIQDNRVRKLIEKDLDDYNSQIKTLFEKTKI